jgi:hypothetical protein
MESENVAALRRGFDAVRLGDLERAADMLDPSFEIGERLAPEGRPNIRGPEALLANVAEIREAFGDVTWETLESRSTRRSDISTRSERAGRHGSTSTGPGRRPSGPRV